MQMVIFLVIDHGIYIYRLLADLTLTQSLCTFCLIFEFPFMLEPFWHLFVTMLESAIFKMDFEFIHWAFPLAANLFLATKYFNIVDDVLAQELV